MALFQNVGADEILPILCQHIGMAFTVAVTGTCPVAQMQAYARELTALGKGRTQLSLAFEAYHPCTPAQQQYLAEQTGYDPERDVENTPDSVFCSHGAGYPVKWNEAPAQMHIQLK